MSVRTINHANMLPNKIAIMEAEAATNSEFIKGT
jgi:hypothetical protein